MSGSAAAASVSLPRAWVDVLTGPREFFATQIRPQGQARGLTFAMAVIGIEEASRLVLDPGAVPVVGGQQWLSALFWVGLAVLVVTPAALHLVAAFQTLLLMPFVSDRGTVSETVQLLSYATAPCLLAGVPIPAVRLVAAAWGAYLLAVGIGEVHGPWFEPALFLSALPSALVFGYGFRGFDALATLLARWYII